jgi:ATP-dependent RNA helicase RhlB
MVEIDAEKIATDTVEQKIYIASTEEKMILLQNILRSDEVDSVMVFANRRDICRTLHEKLQSRALKSVFCREMFRKIVV